MTSTRKKKKVKCDPRASEQMRKWLTDKKKNDSTPPVPFSVFSKVVENLPDIAFQIQCNEPGAANKSLDECALWYYNTFYSEPTIRTKYEYKLRSCPLRVKQKLLQGSTAGSSDEFSESNDIGRASTEDGYEVTVNRAGRFLFPVSLATFERYIHKTELLNMLVRKETKSKTKRAELLLDKDVCRKLLRKYYNSFYINSSRRHMEICKFETAPAALRQQLLKMGVPLDELAIKTMQMKSQKSRLPTSPNFKAKVGRSPQGKPPVPRTPYTLSIVSFNEFEKYIINIYDIVWRLKLNDPDYSYKGFEDCAYEYYFAFYLTPEIREKYPYVLAPCTTAMKNRILSVPSPEDRKTLLQMKTKGRRVSTSQPIEQDTEVPQSTSPAELDEEVAGASAEHESPPGAVEEHLPDVVPSGEEHLQEVFPTREEQQQEILPPVKLVGDKWSEIVPPVSFKLFKRYIRNLDDIVQQMLYSGEYNGRTADECALEYYNRFYWDPEIRKQFKYQVKPCPGRVREKLLSLPGEVDLLADIPAIDKGNALLAAERKLITIDDITYEFQISFETFVKYINYEELGKQLALTYEMEKGLANECPSDEQLLKHFYYLFYTDPRVREQFKYNFDAAPLELRKQLMQLAEPVQKREVEKSPLNELCEAMAAEDTPEHDINTNTGCTEISTADCELDVVEDLGSCGRFKFPVSFDTFMRCINHQELLRPLLLRLTQDEEELAAMTSPLHPQCHKILKRYYRSFYVRPSTRDLYEYRFANVSAELLEKLLEYAEPLDEMAKQQMAQAAEEYASENKKKKQEQLEEIAKTLPVTFKLFKRNIRNLEEIVQCMMSDGQHKDMSEDECAFEYYIEFYTKPEVRGKYAYELKPCPSKLREKFLQLNAASSATEMEHSGAVEAAESKELDLQEVEPKNSEQGEQVNIETPAAPGIPQIECNVNERNKNKNVSVQDDKTLVYLEGKTYEFPVSLQTFKRCINYDTIRIELANSFSKDKQKVEKILREERYDLILLRRFYHSFYIDPRVRKLCNYNFNAAPAELQEKLLGFAVQCSPKPTEAEDTSGSPVGESQAEQMLLPRIELQVDQEKEALPQPQSSPAITFPVSFNIFSKTLNLDEVVRQMQQEPQYAKATAHDCMLAYYEAFYRTPEIREKYKCTFKPCPSLLKAKLLQLPLKSLASESSAATENRESTQGSAAVYAARRAKLHRYAPYNLKVYIDKRAARCPRKCDLLSEHFAGKQTDEQRQNIEIVWRSLETYEKAAAAVRSAAAAREATAAKETFESESSTTTIIINKTKTVTATTTTTTTIAETAETIRTTETVRNANEATEIGGSAATAAAAESTTTATSEATNTDIFTKVVMDLTKAVTEKPVDNASSSTTTSSGIALQKAKASVAVNKAAPQASTAATKVAEEMANDLHLQSMNPALSKEVMVPTSALEAVEEFFTPVDKVHNMKYLLCTSRGLKNTIWRILSHLTYTEFKLYTSIYGAASLYEDDNILSLCYYFVLSRGNWPTNFYVKLRMLPQLLQKKGVKLDSLDLGQLSPKMLHREDLIHFTNFDEIVERSFHARTGHEIANLQDLFNEAKKFYAMCWSQDRWLHQVPQITEELAHSINWTDNMPMEETTPPATLPLCMAHSSSPVQVISSQSSEERQEEINSTPSDQTGATVPETPEEAIEASQSSTCPPTQLDVSPSPPCFVDMQNVQPASQAMEIETQNDPLNQSNLVPAEKSEVQVKTEPIKFLNMMRFSLHSDNSSDTFNCELIAPEDQVINLDTDEEKRSEELACLEISNSIVDNVLPSSCPNTSDSYQNLLAEVHRLDDELNPALTAESQLPAPQPEETVKDTNAQQAEEPAPALPVKSVPAKKQTQVQIRKKTRCIMPDNVPQLRHEFRPLPVAAMVRIEADGLMLHVNKDGEAEEAEEEQQPATSSQVQQVPLQSEPQSVSQALATDNTLMESSQLQNLLDAPYINQRKVNVEEISDSNKNNSAALMEMKRKNVVFRSLERYMAFSALTKAQISRYHINSLSVGSPYQQALICVDGRLCNVTGPLLQILFSRCTASLRADLEHLLRDMDEFCYNCRKPLRADSTEDLRTRVLYMFMRVAPPFVRFRLEFENETREWAACSAICEQEKEKIKPKSDVQTVIRPEILERMKQLKFLLLHPYH
ncbi:protein telomere ends associated isoform X2 [Drosophila mojavensis]|uniref:Uncharacterized protein, isoform C n=1 Tax=Drosophila mojavensis TaxID=7230 RepID=B4KRG7_DROMO|nr:protein telomere ends associated isoform X2 [Drosophila mojavensis]EDW10393.2 uncharacterized protein Dmoj_GI21059, isoform C [Drosophila mojavensis]